MKNIWQVEFSVSITFLGLPIELYELSKLTDVISDSYKAKSQQTCFNWRFQSCPVAYSAAPFYTIARC